MEVKCKQCDEVKSHNEFYEYKKGSGVFFSKCKECVKSNVSKHRVENIEKLRAYDRNRPNKAERVLANKERLDSDPIAKKKYDEQRAEWSKKNRHKRNANLKVSRAIMRGTIKREYNCSKCNSDIRIEAHHEDYEKPLEVIWLCSKCHHARHKEMKEEKRNAIF